MTLKSTTTRAKLSTSSEDLAVQLGKINKWYDSLVPTGGASGNILGWNSDGTAKWVTVAPSANKLNVSSAVGGTSQPVYFKADGTPEAISFTIEKSVPSSAVFTDEKVKSTLLAQSTAAASYRPTFVSGAATGGVSIINSYQVNHTPGTTSAVGNTRLVLGNSTASGTANNEEGQIKLYSPGTALHTIKGATISSEAVHVLPSTGGTILNDQTTSYTQTVASSATGAYEIGKIKINGTTTTIYGKDTGTSYGISGAYGANNNTWVTTITAGGTGTTSTVPTASTSAYGITKLYNGVDSTSTGLAATANAVKTAYDKANHSHPYLPLSGGTLTGPLTLKNDQYGENYGLDCTNSNIIGVNAIRFADSSEMYTEGISFARSTSGYWDTIWANNGEFYFTPNHQTDVTGATSYKVLHTNNTSFSRSLTSGTKIGTITIAGTATDIYAPSASTVNNASLTLKGAGTTVTTFTANASTNQSLDIVAGSNVTITPDATNHKITIASSPDELISKTLTAATFDSTSGNFFFKGNSLFGGTDNFDWVGIQGDATNDAFQLVAGGGNGVFYREKDDESGWGTWHSLMINNMILGSSGITVTPNTVKIGGDDGTTINTGVTISHSNSITAQSSTVFKKFSYDANGHITETANVAASDIPNLNYVKTAPSTNYDINQPGYYAVMSNQNTENPDIDYELPTTNQWWHVLSMSYSGNSGDVTNWMSQLAIPTYQSKLRGLYWRTNSAANTALTADDWKRVFCEERIVSTATATGTRNILHLWGQTVGNDASKLVSGTAGVLSYGDAGPQINFSTNSTIGAAQDSAIIWTDHDTAATGASWHFVSSQSDWNVISKRFHARTGISIGTDLPNKTYNLYVHGTTFHSDSVTFGTPTSIVTGAAIYINTRETSTYSTAVKWSNGETWGTRGAEIGYHNTGGDSTNPGTICILPYQTDTDPWDGQVGLFIKKDHVYIDGVELSKTDANVTQTATTTNADYEVLFSATADNTTRTETARKNSNLKFNPSTGMLNAGRLTLTSATWGGLIINRTASSSHAVIIFQQNGTELGAISMAEADSPLIRWKAGSSTSYKVYDEGHVQPMLWRYVPSGDPGSATDAGVYPAYTAAYMQGTGAFGGSTGRLGNSGTTYWAHYLTFTHNSSFRYILRFPFWGPPQFQHTNNDTDQKWSNFITDEHVGNYSRCMGTGTAIDPITGAMTHMHRANKLAFPTAANITVQISNDSGSTWSNLSVTDTLKRQIFSLPGRSSGVKIGPTSGNATTAMQTRIIFECDGRDVVLNRFLFGIGSDYHTIAIDVYAGSTLSGLTKIATGDASGTWAYEAVATIDNIPSKYYRFSTSNYKFFAFVFRYVTVDSSHLTNRGSVNSIAGFSGIFWGSNGKSNLANYDHMYSWDVDQNVDFPADVAGNSLSAPTVNVSSSSYKASVTASGLTQNRAITIGDVSGDVGIVKVLHDNPNYAAGQTVAITTAEKFKYFIVTVKPNNTFGEKTEIIRITQDTSVSTKYISFTGGIGPAPSQPTITLGGYITHQYNTTSKTYTIGAGHAANYILCNNNVSSVSADSITLAITKIVGLA